MPDCVYVVVERFMDSPETEIVKAFFDEALAKDLVEAMGSGPFYYKVERVVLG